ncbi:MAG: UBA/THIF-type binding protein [Moraxellaceae bacterium]|jgi:hypothetical protein|nr:UBA/THIF-type binding protein [Moraxellaceae bacterium]
MSSMSGQALAAALAAVDATLISPPELADGQNSLAVEAMGARLWQLRVDFRLPLTAMPSVYLVPPSEGAGLSHVSHTGSVCYSDHEGEGFDPADVANVIAFAVKQAVAVLNVAYPKKMAGDFQELLDEFEGYWASIGGGSLVALATPPVPDQLYAQVRQEKAKPGRGGGPVLLALDQGTGSDLKLPRRKAHFFRLKQALLPPVNGASIQLSWLSDLLQAAGPSAQSVSQQPGLHVFLFAQPRSQGEALFGLMFKTIRGPQQAEFTQLQPFSIQRTWRDYLLARTGAASQRRRVVIIGCGAIGGRIAEQLALTGLDELVLVDDDYVSHDNIYRHVLGRTSVDKRKVEALKQELESKRTGLDVQVFVGTAEQWLQDPQRRAGCDTIVLATGQLALERTITRRAFDEGWPQLLVSTWLEPLGLGGHVMASRSGVIGCLECLHTDIGGSRPDTRVAFLKSGQAVSRNITGCGGRFMPYSALHATETALLASKVVLAGEPGYRCWAGDATVALAEGFELMPWHARCRQHLAPEIVSVAHQECPCCSS